MADGATLAVRSHDHDFPKACKALLEDTQSFRFNAVVVGKED